MGKRAWRAPTPTFAPSGPTRSGGAFGYALTSLPNDLTQGPRPVAALLSGALRIPIATCYADVPAGTPVAVPGSTGYLEIAINRGHAARTLQLVRGQSLRAEFSHPPA